jgi:peroxiredoxin Q/BCP
MESRIMRIALSSALLALFCLSPALADMPAVGDQAPAFEMAATDGKTYTLEDFKGKQALIIAWYPRAFTGGCTKECKSFKEAGDQLRKFNVAYFTASTDPVDKNTEFAKSLDLDYPILSDPSGKAATAFGVLRPDGKAAARVTFIIGKDGKVLDVDSKVATDTHAQDLAKKLESLGIATK